MRDLGMWTRKMWELLDADEKTIAQFQRNLEALRRIAGWSQAELADQIGVDLQTIIDLENSRTYRMSNLQYTYLYTVLERRTVGSELLRQVMPIVLKPDEEQQTAAETVTEMDRAPWPEFLREWDSDFLNGRLLVQAMTECSGCGNMMDLYAGGRFVCPNCGREEQRELRTPSPDFECFACGCKMDWYGDVAICPECGHVDKIL